MAMLLKCRKAKVEIVIKQKKRTKQELKTGSFLCVLCDLSFSSEQFYTSHLKNRHANDANVAIHSLKKTCKPETTKPETTTIPKTQKKTEFQCDLCQKFLSCKGSLVNHMNVHQGKKPFICGVCGKDFCDNGSLVKHLKTHTGEKHHKCPTCSKAFLSGGNMRIHMVTHTQERKFKCETCGKCFLQKQHLTKHVKSIHLKLKSEICDICNKEIADAYRLKLHLRTHSGEKPYTCKECSKEFRTTSSLKSHLRRHDGGERPYACTLCDKTFTQISDLRKHTVVHITSKQFACSECDFLTTSEFYLKNHKKKMHSHEDKSTVCPMCQKNFETDRSKLIHMKKTHKIHKVKKST